MQSIAASATVAAPCTPSHAGASSHARGDLTRLALGAVGVVYGDIGTSPLYAIKECVTVPCGVVPVTANIFGVLSLVFWSLTLVVSIKYLLFVMRADNEGEGGVLALLALVASRDVAGQRRRRRLLLMLPPGGDPVDRH